MSLNLNSIFLILLLSIIYIKPIKAQDDDYTWWNIKHNWDGVSSWTSMLKVFPAYFGPNALPVPELRTGLIEDQFRIEFRPEIHHSTGDLTVNLFTSFIAPIGKRASFEVFLVPSEYFKMDTLTRDDRFTRKEKPEGYAGGDFWFGTNIQLIKNRNFPDLLFSAYFKTASGTNLVNARYTDSPAYFVLLNAGKDLTLYKSLKARIYANIGTYIWQMYINQNNQNQDDALQYGIGIKHYTSKFFVKTDLTGYFGYLNLGDRPLVFRLQTGLFLSKADIAFRYQIGLNDYDYQSFALSYTYKFGKPLD